MAERVLPDIHTSLLPGIRAKLNRPARVQVRDAVLSFLFRILFVSFNEGSGANYTYTDNYC